MFIENNKKINQGDDIMPLVRFDLQKGRSPEQIKRILDVTHTVVVDVFKVPQRDRYQIVTQHEPYEMVIQDTGLGFERSEKVVVISITSSPRKKEDIIKFYKTLAERLAANQLVDPKDLMVNMVLNTKENWSFGYGKAQFLTGEL
ncbi:4-oxalocrotonate tautomerase [Liquorilactobacillus nagelii DSM 13675]|nr:4-oxalocrotonate tautomerase [Liquorilactobacillus nagelii DSM 13675]